MRLVTVYIDLMKYYEEIPTRELTRIVASLKSEFSILEGVGYKKHYTKLSKPIQIICQSFIRNCESIREYGRTIAQYLYTILDKSFVIVDMAIEEVL